MSIITGFHHIAMKCCGQEEFEKTVHFYHDIYGLPIERSWENGLMIRVGESFLEIFNDGTDKPRTGFVRHFAIQTEDVDGCIEKARAAGYEIMEEPHNIEFASDPPYPARIAFVRGPVGEELEFFAEL
ncbi:MAG: VOC family protein [Oscillospiraceae bacterium]|nr:VOC family protein [Oscillospiraceae bacterium]